MSDFLDLGLVNTDAEKAVLGALLIDPDGFDTLDLAPDDFYLTACGEIFGAMRELRHQRTQIDYITVSDRLQAGGDLARVGGQAFLLELLTTTPSALNIESYARIIVDLSARRQGYRKAQEFVRGLCKKDRPVDETISEFAASVPHLVRVKGGLQHVAVFAEHHYDRMDSLLKGEEQNVRFKTGITDFDAATYGGLIRGELMLLSGQPGMGKTKLLMQMGAGVARNGAAVGVYEMETDEEEIMDREMSRESKIPSEHMLTGLEGEDLPLYTQAMERYFNPDFPLYIDFSPRWSIAGLRADLLRAKTQFGLAVFMVDYLKFISDRYGRDEIERLNYISGELKMICREMKLAGVVIHAMNKDGARSNTPDLTSLSQGMDIVYDADKVCLLNSHMPMDGSRPSEGMRTFIFLKSRRKLKFKTFDLVAIKEWPEMGPAATNTNAQIPRGRS